MKKLSILFCLLTIFGASLSDAQILYKIDGNGLKESSYVFGSHHLAPIAIVEESGAMNYFDHTSRVVGEIDLTIDPLMLSLKLRPFMMAPADSTLSKLISAEDMELLDEQFQKWSPVPGMKLQMLEPLKPIAVTSMIAAGISTEAMPGFDSEEQLDTYFFKKGKERGMEIIGLETPEYQGEVLFESTPLTIQAEALVEMLRNPEQSVEAAAKLSKAYVDRDLDAMFELSKQDDEHPEFMEKMLNKRNAEWMEKLPEIINEAPSFIVVGALHLAGEKGILEYFRSLGYTVTPLY